MNDNKTNRLDCDIVRDLLPLYHDKVVSEVTEKAVYEHLLNCSDCSAEYETLTSELNAHAGENSKERFLQVMKKIRHNTAVKYACIAAVTVAALGGIWYLLTQVPLRKISPDEINVLRAYKYEFGEEDKELKAELAKSVVNDINSGVFIYYEMPAKCISGPGESYIEKNGDTLNFVFKRPIINIMSTHDDPDKMYQDIWNVTDLEASGYSKFTINGKPLDVEEENVPDYVKEYLLWEYCEDSGVATFDDKTITIERGGYSTTWDIDGNKLYKNKFNPEE